MKFQLVLQFPEEKYGDLDWIIDLEDSLDSMLVDAQLDGHDMGSGEVNIFIDCNDPELTFQAIKDALKQANEGILKDVKAAYRDFNESQFACLWPVDLREFRVL